MTDKAKQAVEEVILQIPAGLDQCSDIHFMERHRETIQAALEVFLLALDEWETMDSAPMDGSIIVLHGTNCLDKSRTVMARYTKKHNEISDGCGDIEWLDDFNGEYYYPEGWYEMNWCNEEYHSYKISDRSLKPTHWKPLTPKYQEVIAKWRETL